MFVAAAMTPMGLAMPMTMMLRVTGVRVASVRVG